MNKNEESKKQVLVFDMTNDGGFNFFQTYQNEEGTSKFVQECINNFLISSPNYVVILFFDKVHDVTESNEDELPLN